MNRYLVFAIILTLASCQMPTSQTSFTGTVSVKGNEPFTYVALTNFQESYELSGELANEISLYQGEVVTVFGGIGTNLGRTVIYVEGYRKESMSMTDQEDRTLP